MGQRREDGCRGCPAGARVRGRDCGVSHEPRDESMADLSVLPEREGFSTTNRRAIERNGRSFLTTFLCTALTTMAMCQNSEFIEIGCNNLGVAIGNEGILHRTVDYKNGFNLDHRIGTNATVDLIKQTAPAFVWVSLPGERLCKVIGEWSPTAWRNYERLRRRDLQRSAEVADGIVKVMANGGHFAWEWDKRAHFGWKGRAIEKIRKAAEECDRELYECHVDACHYARGEVTPTSKSWRILTSSKQLYHKMMRKCCPGHKHHEPTSSSRVPYPARMVEEIASAVMWQLRGETGLLKDDLQHYLCDEVPSVFAVQRSGSFPMERPTGRKMDDFKSQLLKLHKAAGHSSLDSLSRLLERRGAPAWAVSLAKEIKCPECLEEKRLGPPPSSTDKPPGLWELLGMDVCEYEFVNPQTSQREKAKFLIMIDRASRFCCARLSSSVSCSPIVGTDYV